MVRNFKSFNGIVRLNFDPGFNIITGPNGSGKSNIIDAVQFVFGELASKRMRVPDLAGLIYDSAGEDGSRPQFSQVTIYFNNSDRALAIDRKTVSVGRRIDRQGKSKYFLNGRRTSRRKLLDMLVMAGITPGGYNIVLQGMATRLSDLTPSERMRALEDLVGLTEYDNKKSEAKVRLAEAERKIEVANAKGDEVRKSVNELEHQRNDALRYILLSREEQRLEAYRLTHQIAQLESKLKAIKRQAAENQTDIESLEVEKEGLLRERDAARDELESFTDEAAEKGNTRLPLLKSELVGKRAMKNSLDGRLRDIDSRKTSIQENIEDKLTEIENSKLEIGEKRKELEELTKRETQLDTQIKEKQIELQSITEKISTLKGKAEENQTRVEKLTVDLVPMHELLSGFEIGINRHNVNVNTLESKIQELENKRDETLKTIEALQAKIVEFNDVKTHEALKLEDMLDNIEEQVKQQKSIRNTILGANELAKDAEITITEFTAKRDLWKNVVTEEKAQDRIREMGEAGALKGYHGPLRSLVKIDLKYQRAARVAADNWINAIVVDDFETALECVEGLKKNRLGMTRFIPLNHINPPEPLDDIKDQGIEGYIPNILRYDDNYRPAVLLIWGDTFIAKDRETARSLTRRGYRAVTLSGDLFEVDGGLLGGHWRRPPDFSKLIPSEESINELSNTIKTLRSRLSNKMKDLKLSGDSLRKFTSFMDDFNDNIDGINTQITQIKDSIKRLERKISTIDENIKKIVEQRENELDLISTLQERKESTLHKIEQTKNEILELKELSPADIASLEVAQDAISREITNLRDELAHIISDISVQTSLVDKYLELKATDSQTQTDNWREEIKALEAERLDIEQRIEEESREIVELEKVLNSVTSEVEATSRVLEHHRRTVRRFEQQIERLENRRLNLDRKNMELSVEEEKIRLQTEQRFEELARIGFGDTVPIEAVNLSQIEYALLKVRREKASLGAINQLAIQRYKEVVINYKYLSIRINELEDERGSILKFIDEIEKEKQAQFMRAFNEVCENFSNIFERLTGGGDGRLELQKPEDPFSGGVDLYVQFPGKPMRLAGGASGGERSVAAIAYLLAIQRFLKAPFYLFDEIDAHLDDLNTARLAEVLKDSALEAQFLMVSLKDVMVHNADKIYGVFAQAGRSKVLSLPMKVEVKV